MCLSTFYTRGSFGLSHLAALHISRVSLRLHGTVAGAGASMASCARRWLLSTLHFSYLAMCPCRQSINFCGRWIRGVSSVRGSICCKRYANVRHAATISSRRVPAARVPDSGAEPVPTSCDTNIESGPEHDSCCDINVMDDSCNKKISELQSALQSAFGSMAS